jgi:cell division protein FtsW
MTRRKSVYFLVVAVLAMLVLGIVMLYSTSAFARDSHGDAFYFIKRQAIWLGVGVVACAIGAAVDYHFWQRTCWIWLAVAAVLLALCFVPHVGMRINGARRWIGHGALRFQPSDFAKLAALAFLAHWFSKYEKDARQFFKGFVFPIAIVGVLLALIAREIDIGTTALIGGTMIGVMFVAGAGWRFLFPSAAAGVVATIYVAFHMKERLGRMLAFLDLEKYKDTWGLQQWQALIAFGSGGVEGLGLGNGRQKMSYLPFAHTDFILPMVGEELGLRVTLLIVLCYLAITLCGTVIAVQARDRFGMLLGFGITVMIALQAAINIGVTTALLPNKGLPLPFISYGGSNLVFCLLGVGILINIYRQGSTERTSTAATALRVRTKLTPRI